jgi:hypothetical protein
VGRGVIVSVGQRGDSRVIREPASHGNGVLEMRSRAQALRGFARRKLSRNNDSFGVCRPIRGLFPKRGI